MVSKKRVARRRDAGRPRGAPVVQAVLTHALSELACAGLDGLSVERVARRAGVNKTSVYRRWPTREALVAAALEGILKGVAAHAPDTGSLRSDLQGLLQRVVDFVGTPVGRAVVRAGLSEAAASSVAQLASRLMQRQAASPVRLLVARARERGEWRAGVRGEAVIFTLVGAVLHRAMLEHQPLSKRWLHALVDLVLLGALPRAAQRVRAAGRGGATPKRLE